jgi:hypothetical protein
VVTVKKELANVKKVVYVAVIMQKKIANVVTVKLENVIVMDM